VRRFLLSTAWLVFCCTLTVPAWAAPKDTPSAHQTRTAKLTAKISVDWTDTPLKDCVVDLKKAIEEAVGSVSFHLATGVSMNQKITYKADGKTLAEILDGMFKKNGLGYIVESKANDRMDGWIIIRQGTERGYAEGEEPAAKPAGKKPAVAEKPKADKPKTEDPKEAPAGDDDATEKKAAAKLKLAKALIDAGKTAKAKERLKELIKDFPKTNAAKDAQSELDKLEGK
jgi:hypothetical protein